MDTEKRTKELANERFNREELGPLLRLFSSLGITLTVGIIVSVLVGLYLNRRLAEFEIDAYGLPGIAIIITGITISLYWCYLRIEKHMSKFSIPNPERKQAPDHNNPEKGEDQ